MQPAKARVLRQEKHRRRWLTVSTASADQARGIEQISKAISQVDQVTQKTAASAEESASVGHELSAHSDSQRAVVASLRRMAGTGARQGQSAR